MDWLRNLGKSKAERDEEMATAYVDGELSDSERNRFEARLKADDALRADIEAQQALKENLRNLPRLSAPRSFVLDPAVYGTPERPSFFVRVYPQLRAATAVMSLLFVFSLFLSTWSAVQTGTSSVASAPAMLDEVAMQSAPAEAEFAMEEEESVDVEEEMVAEEAMMDTAEAEFEADAMEADVMAEDAAYEVLAEEEPFAATPSPAPTQALAEEAMLDEATTTGAMAESAAFDGEFSEDDSVSDAAVADILPEPTTEPISPRATATEEAMRAADAPIVAEPVATAVVELAEEGATVDNELDSQTENPAERAVEEQQDDSFDLLEVLIIAQVFLGVIAATLLTLTFVARREII